jgi:hypothetical protein
VAVEGVDPTETFMSLLCNVFKMYGRKVVVLIDEYDAPVLRLVQFGKTSVVVDFGKRNIGACITVKGKETTYLEPDGLGGLSPVPPAAFP